MVEFDARTKKAESWLPHAAETGWTGVTGRIAGRALRLNARESRDFLPAFKNAGLTVEGFSHRQDASASK